MSADLIGASIPIAAFGMVCWIVFIANWRKVSQQRNDVRKQVLQMKENLLSQAIREGRTTDEMQAILRQLDGQNDDKGERREDSSLRYAGWTIATGVASALLGAILQRILGLQSNP